VAIIGVRQRRELREALLVALHQCPHRDVNRGVHVDAIRSFLNEKGLELED
jgi:hypothetical protein